MRPVKDQDKTPTSGSSLLEERFQPLRALPIIAKARNTRKSPAEFKESIHAGEHKRHIRGAASSCRKFQNFA
jgi:hypothetical protein